MAAYLIVDFDDLLRWFTSRNANIDLQELAVALRGNAALAAGLFDSTLLRAIAISDWESHRGDFTVDPQTIFRSAGYDDFNNDDPASLVDRLIAEQFDTDPNPIDELILATTRSALLPLIRRIKTTDSSRVRIWGGKTLPDAEFADKVIFQPLERLPGIQSKNVWVYIDFENISISLNEQGFVVNLDHLIERFTVQAQAHGKVVKMYAYAPWTQRGSLPPLVDKSGREIAEDATSRLLMANIEPVITLPGKNSADLRIANDVVTHAGHPEAGDVIILASGDRDFNDVINSLAQRSKTVVLWSVRGSTSRQLEKHLALQLEYIDDFTALQTHQSLSSAGEADSEAASFVPSQWSSVIIQFYRLHGAYAKKDITTKDLIQQLQNVGAVVSPERGQDLVSQSISLGILKEVTAEGVVDLDYQHPVVEKTLLIVDRIARRVANTLETRNWEYVNYGFLLKGLEMERDIDRPGMNESDQWRSHWIDCLVREGVLRRELVPHRHNPEDVVPVIRIPYRREGPVLSAVDTDVHQVADQLMVKWLGVPPHRLYKEDVDIARMVMRIVVSVEQFTSFRNFAWCPLGSLHRRLSEHDAGMAFQRAVEYLVVNDMVRINEYPNPRSEYNTKGIELNHESSFVAALLAERDEFIRVLLEMYSSSTPISQENIEPLLKTPADVLLWISIMKTENVLNLLPGHKDQFSLFRTHHTVKLVANDDADADDDGDA